MDVACFGFVFVLVLLGPVSSELYSCIVVIQAGLELLQGWFAMGPYYEEIINIPLLH